MERIFLGVAADDFTGASDAASFLVEAGIPTVLFSGVPAARPELKPGTRAVVIALKSRTEPVGQAVEESLAAFDWLRSIGAEKLYFKYCSTFDSTSDGNIGPVIDSVMERYGFTKTVLCPSLPVNGRVVRGGRLYVNGVLLEESHMKDHPLTPMRKSRISELMKGQGKHPSVELSVEELSGDSWKEKLPAEPCYVIPDYYEEKHGDLIAEAFGDLEFLTGGSGLAGALGRWFMERERAAEDAGSDSRETAPQTGQSASRGRAIFLAGSCSAVTLKQIADYQEKGYPSLRIQPQKLWEKEQTRETIWRWLHEPEQENGLVYSSAAPEDLKKSQELGRERIAGLIEEIMSGLAAAARDAGYTRFIIAGGETSGAVTKALGYEAFYIGPSVAPGVPVMTPLAAPEVRLVLKSGNFGQPDFFARALEMTLR